MEIASSSSPIPVGRAKYLWLLGGLLLLVIISWFVGGQVGQKKLTSGASTEPLLITPSQQHLGKLLQHEKKEFSFTVQNQGKEAIHILKVEFSCGCTEAKALKEVLTPGEATQIMGSLNAESRVGEFGSQISVSYQTDSQRDRGDQEVMQLKAMVGAKAVTLVNLPSHLDLGSTILGQEPREVTFEVTKGEAEVEWDGLNLKAEKVKSEIKKLGDGKWKVMVWPPKGDVIESSREDLTFQLFNSGNPEADLRQEILSASWKVVSENFSVSPQGVYLSGDHVARVRIKNLRERPFDISHIKIPRTVPIQIKQVREDGLRYLELQIFQIKSNLTKQSAKSGKIQWPDPRNGTDQKYSSVL